jgi:hypothetical protein
MHYKNDKGDFVFTANTTMITSSITFIFLLVTLVLSFVVIWAVLSASIIPRVEAKMNDNDTMGSMMSSSSNSMGSNMSSNMGSNMMTIPAKAPQLNISTAAPPLTPAMFKQIAPQMHVDLTNATMIAEKWVGGNSHAVSSVVGIQDGVPVYSIWVIDGNSGLHQIVVDPQNGKVLFANQPMSMTGPFS